MAKIFVYGTLKSGYGNHSRFLSGIEYKMALAEGLELRSDGYLPYAVKGKGIIKGEVYEVSEQKLKQIDSLEGHPNWYKRELVPTLLEDGNQIKAWIYLNEGAKAYRKILVGEWRSYSLSPI